MNIFSRIKTLNRIAAGATLGLFALASIFSFTPLNTVHAAGITGLLITGYAEDASKTTLHPGDQLIANLDYRSSLNDLQVDPNGQCQINGQNVTSSFQNFGDGTAQLVYTVGPNDPSIAMGQQMPFACSFTDTGGNSGLVVGFTTEPHVAIDATGGTTDNGGGTTTGTTTDTGGTTGGTTGQVGNATVTASPSSGTLGIGQTITINIEQLDHMNDLTMANGFCKINNVQTNNLQNLGNGNYTVTHTYTNQDANINAGELTFTCDVKNGAGQTATLHFTSGNTVAIATQSDNNNNGLPPPGTFQVTAEPSTGTINPGGSVIVHANDSGGVTDFAVDPAGTCTVNGKDVKSSFQAFGDHTYQMLYNVAEGDPNVVPGQLAVSCSVKNPAGTTGIINTFTDNNTLAIAGGGTTGTGTGTTTTATTTDNGGGTTTGTTTDNGGGNTNNNNGGNTTGTTTGTIGGDVNGGTNTNTNGVLAVTSIEQVKSVAVADGTLENGWSWIFHVTVPTNESNVTLKFGNWMHSNGINSISPVQNMSYYSNQAVNTLPVIINASDTYSDPISLTGDLDSTIPGRQVEIVVRMGVPVGSANGAYTTTYGIKSTQ